MYIIGVYKPSGESSFDTVRKIKKLTGIKKIGHGGTLDPMADGVLPILLNEATAFFDYLLASDKIYEAEITLGSSTDTDDKEGAVLERAPVPDISIEDILAQTVKLTGRISQVPPKYSALKINGKKAYELAREGKDIEMKPRMTSVHEWSGISYENGVIKAVIRCGSGTYIRSLARDLGELLGTKAHLSALRRTYSGGISIEDTFSPDSGGDWRDYLITPEKALDFLPSVEWKGDFAYLLNGRPLDLDIEGVCVLTYKGRIAAVIENINGRTVYKKNLANYYKDKF